MNTYRKERRPRTILWVCQEGERQVFVHGRRQLKNLTCQCLPPDWGTVLVVRDRRVYDVGFVQVFHGEKELNLIMGLEHVVPKEARVQRYAPVILPKWLKAGDAILLPTHASRFRAYCNRADALFS